MPTVIGSGGGARLAHSPEQLASGSRVQARVPSRGGGHNNLGALPGRVHAAWRSSSASEALTITRQRGDPVHNHPFAPAILAASDRLRAPSFWMAFDRW